MNKYHAVLTEFPASQNFYEGDVSVWIVFLGVWEETNKIKGLALRNSCEWHVYAEVQAGRAANFYKFVVLWLFARIFGAWHPQRGKSEQFSPRKSYFHQFAKFSPSKVSAVR